MDFPSWVGNFTEKSEAADWCGAGDYVGKMLKVLLNAEVVN